MSEHTPSVFASGYAHHCLRKVCGTKIVYDLDVALHQTGDRLPGRPIHRLLTEMEVLPRIQRNRFGAACRSHDMQIPATGEVPEPPIGTDRTSDVAIWIGLLSAMR